MKLRPMKTTTFCISGSERKRDTSDALDKTRIANVAIAVPPAIPALPTHGFDRCVRWNGRRNTACDFGGISC